MTAWGGLDHAEQYAQHLDERLRPEPTAVHHVSPLSYREAFDRKLAENVDIFLEDELKGIRYAA